MGKWGGTTGLDTARPQPGMAVFLFPEPEAGVTFGVVSKRAEVTMYRTSSPLLARIARAKRRARWHVASRAETAIVFRRTHGRNRMWRNAPGVFTNDREHESDDDHHRAAHRSLYRAHHPVSQWGDRSARAA